MGKKYATFDDSRRINAFYDDKLSPVPDGVINEIEISYDDYQRLLDGQSIGKWMVINDAGEPDLIDPPGPTNAEILSATLAAREERMAMATRSVAPLQDAVDLNVATPDEKSALTAWKQYRVALNRIEQQTEFPQTINWPVVP